MSERMPIDITMKGSLGTVSFAEEVVTVIAGLAVQEVPGVLSLTGNISSGINEMFGRKSLTKGVRVEVENYDVSVDVSVVLLGGYKIPQVGHAIQDNVKKAIETMTGLNVTNVNVHVASISYRTDTEKSKKTEK